MKNFVENIIGKPCKRWFSIGIGIRIRIPVKFNSLEMEELFTVFSEVAVVAAIDEAFFVLWMSMGEALVAVVVLP